MPHTAVGLPFSGSQPASQHTSYLGAQDGARRAARQTQRYLDYLDGRGVLGATDWEAAGALGLERTTINARRNELVKAGQVMAGGYRPGPTGTKNVVWKLREWA